MGDRDRPTTPPLSPAERRGSATSEAADEARARRGGAGPGISPGLGGSIRALFFGSRADQLATAQMNLAMVKVAMAVAWNEVSDEPIPADLKAEIGRARDSAEIRAVRDRIVDRLGDDGEAWFRSFFLNIDRNETGQLDLAFIKDKTTGLYQTTRGEVIDPALVGAESDQEVTSLFDELRGGAPEGALVEVELPFIGGRPGPETVREGQPFFEPEGFPLDDPADVGITRQLLRGAEPGITGVPQAIRNAQLLQPRQRYHLGFDWSPASWDAQRRIILKDSLVRAGYLDPDQQAGGATWAFAEASAMALLADESNGAGVPWNLQLAKVAANPSEAAKRRAKGRAGADRRPFVSPAFLEPDMATLSQAVKGSVRQRLGREPTAREMGELIATLDTDYTAEFGVQVAALRSEFDATTRAIETDEPQAAGSFRSVDPSARFAEHFDQRFAGEIDVRERGAAVNQREAIGAATMSMVDGLIGSRR